ncbi:MAG: hypothetical protein K2M90_07725 [Treponemataceae bacterium]|nr:hypothetical protein [Treponemataceae bacterium]MDE7392326.1 hypothetical protein [Treponemataceae bacterium]
MVTVAKVNGKVRTTELDALSDAMEREYRLACGDGATAVGRDAVLKAQFGQLADLSARNTTAIKQDAVVSTLDAATRDLFTLAGGYMASPFTEVRAAATDVCAVLEKYGRGMTSKNYADQTALTESLLEDLGAEKVAAQVRALSGVAELVAQLRGAQDGFASAHDGYVRAMAGKGESASSLKKPIVSLINDNIVPYLNIVAAVAGNIKNTNDTVARRTAAGKK